MQVSLILCYLNEGSTGAVRQQVVWHIFIYMHFILVPAAIITNVRIIKLKGGDSGLRWNHIEYAIQ